MRLIRGYAVFAQKFLFNTCIANTIGLKRIGERKSQYQNEKFNAKVWMAQVRRLLDDTL